MNKFPEFIRQFPEVNLPMDGVDLNVLKGKQGQVAFFDMKAGVGVPLHEHDDSWAAIIEGEMLVQAGEEAFTAKKGDSWFVPKGVKHGGQAITDCRMIEVFSEQRFEVD